MVSGIPPELQEAIKNVSGCLKGDDGGITVAIFYMTLRDLTVNHKDQAVTIEVEKAILTLSKFVDKCRKHGSTIMADVKRPESA